MMKSSGRTSRIFGPWIPLCKDQFISLFLLCLDMGEITQRVNISCYLIFGGDTVSGAILLIWKTEVKVMTPS